MSPAETEALATRFFDAIEAGDAETVADCYDETVVVWHNYDRLEQGKADNLKVLRGMIRAFPTRVYANRQLEVFAGGFVQQHVLMATRTDGKEVELPAALICRVANGRIVRLDEYFDSAHEAEFRN
ncbi:MAG: nuclear transport factor 2 family protein [Pseudomonadota bacterium]